MPSPCHRCPSLLHSSAVSWETPRALHSPVIPAWSSCTSDYSFKTESKHESMVFWQRQLLKRPVCIIFQTFLEAGRGAAYFASLPLTQGYCQSLRTFLLNLTAMVCISVPVAIIFISCKYFLLPSWLFFYPSVLTTGYHPSFQRICQDCLLIIILILSESLKII